MRTACRKSQMRKLSHEEISSGRARLENLDEVKRMPVVAVIDSIRSMYNTGSIFRTSDGAMIEKLILTGYTPTPEKKEVLKTALGASESIPWEYIQDPVEAVIQLKNSGYNIAALELTDKRREYTSLRYSEFPLALVIGNEITGVSQKVLDLCDFALEIPQYGIKQSLNVAVAYGVAIFELRRVYDSAAKPLKE